MIPVPRSAADGEPDDGAVDDARADDDAPTCDDEDGSELAHLAVEDLRRQESMLAEELRGVGYWRRIARAQTDLLVASLLHAGRHDLDGLHGIGLQGFPAPAFDPCDRLLQLRERDRLMAGYEHGLREDHEAVSRELARRAVGVSTGSVPDASPTSGTS